MLTWFAQIIRSFFFWIDYNLFGFIETLYNLLIDISRTTILTQGDIKEFASRVQMLLGVFMLFKVAFSIITYVINPDEMTDKSKGLAKLGQNAIISLVLLVVTPYIFGMAYDLQIMVLEDNTIANLIFGSTDDDTFIETGGQKLSFSVMIPFFRPDTGISQLSECNNLYQNNGTEFNEKCLTGLRKVVEDWKDSELDDRVIGNYTTGVVNRNFGLTFRSEAVTFLTNDSQFVFNYKIILSTAAAVVVILLLLTFAMDVALRSVKLAFLQLISPIPIISYIDPKQGKDGMFKKWYTMCFSTYISLFIRLLALYFGLYLIDIVINKGFSDVVTGEVSQWGWFNTGMWINLFMIIGILMFIKQLPKILEGFGIKLDGGGKFTLNPFKKFENEAFGGKQILGAGAGIAAAGISGATNIATRLPSSGRALRNMFNKDYWKNSDGNVSVGSVLKGAGRGIHGVFTPVRSGIAGMTGAGFRATKKIAKGEKPGKIFSDSYGEAMFAKIQREDLTRKGSTWIGRRKSDIHRWTGTLDAAQQQVLEYGKLESQYKADQEAIKAQQESLTRKKEREKRELGDKSKALNRINDIISNNKSVKDIDDQIKALTESGGYYAHVGELNAAGRKKQSEIDSKRLNFSSAETSVQNEINELQSQLEYYSSLGYDGTNSIEAAQVEETMKSRIEYLSQLKSRNEAEIRSLENELNSDSTMHYQLNELTEEGQLLKNKLDDTRRSVYTDLKADVNSEVHTQVQILREIDDSFVFEDNDGSFSKKIMYDTQNAVQAVDAKYQADESKLAEDLRKVSDDFERQLKENGLDKNSETWKRNEADHAADKVTAPQPGNFMPSPDTAGASAAYDSRYIGGYSSAGSSNSSSGGTPPPPPPR